MPTFEPDVTAEATNRKDHRSVTELFRGASTSNPPQTPHVVMIDSNINIPIAMAFLSRTHFVCVSVCVFFFVDHLSALLGEDRNRFLRSEEEIF